MAKTLTTQQGLLVRNLRNSLEKLQDNACDLVLNAAGLVIGTSKPKAKIANSIYAKINGTLVLKTTAEIVLAGTVTNAKFNVYVLTINSSGTVTATMGTEGATLGTIVFPTVPENEGVIGFVIVNPTGTGNFVGGTTDLDDATVVPNAVYRDTPFPFNPNAEGL